MTTIQILSLVAVAAAVALTYLPLNAIRLPRVNKAKPPVLGQIESVVAIRQSYTEPAIVDACNALLHALLQVKA